MNIKILDCTLRDGGYINDWEFSDRQIKQILSSLESSNIDIVECGYLNNKKGKYSDSTLFSHVDVINGILDDVGCSAQKVVMINYGDFNIKELPPQKQTMINGIRLAFHKKNLKAALKEAQEIIDLGYQLFFQPMVTKNYSQDEFLSMIIQANKLDIYSFYIVDSFGSMTLSEFNSYLLMADKHLNKKTLLGYHSHNNIQLAFSNAISMCASGIGRDIIIDASIYGIGRGAGNLNTELIADYLRSSFGKDYDTLPLLEVIDEFLSVLMKERPWGFSPAQYLSASFNCHPNYATYLINKNTNHIVGIRKILQRLPDEKKTCFDREYVEKLYIESLLEQKSEIFGDMELSEESKIMLVASGKSIELNEEEIVQKIKTEKLVSIALNFIPKFACDYYFFSNQKRFDEHRDKLLMEKTIITNNVVSQKKTKAVLDLTKYTYLDKDFISNSAVVAINVLVSKGFKSVFIAGLDGLSVSIPLNYAYSTQKINMDIDSINEKNKIIQDAIKYFQKKIQIDFVTPSMFDQSKKGDI